MANEVAELKEVKKGELFLPAAEIEEFAGMGTENVTTSDMLLPRLTLLQSLSPQLNKKKVEFIEGAEIGDWVNVATGDCYKGELIAIPCHFRVSFIEWGKGRSGLVHNWGQDASCLKNTTQNEKRENILPSGNKISETSEWFLLIQDGILWKPAFFPLTSTNLKVSRKWMTISRAEVLQGRNGPFTPPLFYRSWKLTPIEDSNDQGSWYTFVPSQSSTILELDPTKALLNQAKQFYMDVRENKLTGEVVPEDPNDPANAKIVNSEAKM